MFQQILTPQEIDRFSYPSNYDAASIRAFLAPQAFVHQFHLLLIGVEGLFDIDYLHEFHLCLLRESFGLGRRRDNRKMCPVIKRQYRLISSIGFKIRIIIR